MHFFEEDIIFAQNAKLILTDLLFTRIGQDPNEKIGGSTTIGNSFSNHLNPSYSRF